MSTYDDSLLAARFAALAPEPLAGDWDDVLDRAGAREGPSEPGRPAHVQAPSSPAPRRARCRRASSRSSTASAFAVRAFVIDKGIVGLPPVGATPSTPENGVLEMSTGVHHSAEQELGVRRRAADPIWCSAGQRKAAARSFQPMVDGFVEQRLTREGVKLLRSEIVSAGGFGHAQPPPGSKSSPTGPSDPGTQG